MAVAKFEKGKKYVITDDPIEANNVPMSFRKGVEYECFDISNIAGYGRFINPNTGKGYWLYKTWMSPISISTNGTSSKSPGDDKPTEKVSLPSICACPTTKCICGVFQREMKAKGYKYNSVFGFWEKPDHQCSCS